MRSLVFALVLSASAPAPASASEPPAPTPTAAPAGTGTLAPAPVRDPDRPAGFDWGDGKSARGAPAATPATDREPYNWRQMAFGGSIMALMALFLVWLIRRKPAGGAPRR